MGTLERLNRLGAAAVCLLFTAGVLSGCSFRPEPPTELKESAALLAETVKNLPGIRAADAAVNDVDFKDKPGQWFIALEAEAASFSDIDTIPAELTPVLDEARRDGLDIKLVLHIPEGPGLAPTTLGLTSDGSVRTAMALRAIPGVQSVNGTAYGPSFYVSLGSSTTMTTAAPQFRDALRAGGDIAPSVIGAWNEQATTHQVSVDVSPTWPSSELLTALESIDQMGSLDNLSVSAAHDSMPATITVSTSESADVLEVSDRLLDIADTGSSTPVHFWVHGPDGNDLEGTI